MTPLGTVLQRPDEPVDEDDVVKVNVVTSDRLLPLLRVERTSKAGRGGRVRLAGGEVSIGDLGFAWLDRQRAGDEAKRRRRCRVLRAELGDFSPQEPGRVRISLLREAGADPTTLGSFDFSVNPLYTGAFSLGPVFTWLEDPRFRVVRNSRGERILTAAENEGPRTQYVVGYAPYVWGRRDLEKSVARPIERLFPFLALSLEEPGENAYLGGALDLFQSSVFVVGGFHAGRVRRLDPEAGFRVGDPFPGPEEEPPVVEEWRWSGFAGVTLDLRAAVSLLGKVFGAGGG